MNGEDPGLTLIGDAVVLFAAISTERATSPRPAAELPATNRTDLLTFTNTAPATNFVDTDATNFNRRFYGVGVTGQIKTSHLWALQNQPV